MRPGSAVLVATFLLAGATLAGARRIETVVAPAAYLATSLGRDANDNVYVFDRYASRVDRIDSAGVVVTLLGPAGDGLGNLFDCPGAPGWVCNMLVTPAGDVYVTAGETDNVFHVDPSGAVTEVIDATGDGAGHAVDLPYGLAVDTGGNLFVTTVFDDYVFKITPGGAISYVTTLVGHIPWPVADAFGNVFIGGADTVLRYDSLGGLTTMLDATGDGLGNTFDTGSFSAIPALDAAGNVYVTGTSSLNVFKVAPSGAVTLLMDASGDGHEALENPAPAVADSQGAVYIVDPSISINRDVFRIDPGGAVTLWTVGAFDLVAVVDADDNLYLSNSLGLWIVTPQGKRTLLDQRTDGVAPDTTYFGTPLVTPEISYRLTSDSRLLSVQELCDGAPRAMCRRPSAPLASTLVVRDGIFDNKKDALTWKWTHGEATDLDAFGDPATLDYSLCVYGADALLFEASAVAGTLCSGASCWSSASGAGFDYFATGRAPDGVRKFGLRAGLDGQAKVVFKASGMNLPDDLVLPTTLFPLTVQAQSSNGECWEATFAASDASKNLSTRLVVRGQ